MVQDSNKYVFYGINKRTELIIGTAFGLLMIITWIIICFLYCTYMHIEYTRISIRLFGGFGILAACVCLPFLNFAGKYYRGKWIITVTNNTLHLFYKSDIREILLDDIRKIKNYGNSEFRYLTIKSSTRTVYIRTGTSVLTPFSRKDDMAMIDAFFRELRPYLDRLFTKKDNTVAGSPKGTVKLTYIRKQ